jgi:hypothetical protein
LNERSAIDVYLQLFVSISYVFGVTQTLLAHDSCHASNGKLQRIAYIADGARCFAAIVELMCFNYIG